jgi:hypothetical protein
MDAHFGEAVLKFAIGEGVVEIFGIKRVDGEGADLSEIAALGDFIRCNVGRDFL